MDIEEAREKADHTLDITSKIGEILAGEPHEIQGAAIIDVLAKYLAGHSPPECRPDILSNMVETVWKLVQVYHEELWNESKH